METQRVGWIGTHIESTRISPVKTTYSPGEDVVFEGKLIIHGWPDWFPGGDQPIYIYVGEAAVESGKTGPDGVFRIPIKLPWTPGTYAYRAYYPGSGFPAGWDPCSSDTIAVVVAGAPTPTHECPYCGTQFSTHEALVAHIQAEHPDEPIPPPDEEPWWKKYKYYMLAAGAVCVVGLVVAASRKR